MTAASSCRALLVTHYFPSHGGGVEIVAGQVARRIAHDGITVEWFASDTDPAPVYNGVECRPQPALNMAERRWGIPYPLWSLASIVRLLRAVRRSDVVHVHDAIYFANFVASAFALLIRRRLVVTQHVGGIPYRSALLRGLLAVANRVAAHAVLRRADAVVFVSPVVRAYFERLVGPHTRFVHIPNGVDADIFAPNEGDARSSLRRSLGFPSDRPVLLFVGRFVEKKGLRLIRELAQRRPEWHWVLVGDGPIDPAAWGLPNVTLAGRLDQAQLAEHYRAADVLVLPSYGEGFPLVVQEALSSGLPVAVHGETRDAGALPDEVCVTADALAHDAPLRWIDRLRAYLEQPQDAAREQRLACRAFAVRQWSWEATCNRYRTLLQGGTAPRAP